MFVEFNQRIKKQRSSFKRKQRVWFEFVLELWISGSFHPICSQSYKTSLSPTQLQWVNVKVMPWCQRPEEASNLPLKDKQEVMTAHC